jgi:Na+-translocating ferredoxin:NAD+ oxidoreductase RnfG subunit
MLKAFNTKILLAILAALAAIGGTLTYQRHEAVKAASAASKAAAILQLQQKEADERKAEDKAFRQRVEQDRKRHSSAAAHEGKTWQTYIP